MISFWSRAQAFRPESRAWSAVLRHIRLTRARVFTCRLHRAEWADPREALQVNMWAKFALLYWNCRLRLSECLSNLNAAITKVWNVVQNDSYRKCGAASPVRPLDSRAPSINPTLFTAFNMFSDVKPDH